MSNKTFRKCGSYIASLSLLLAFVFSNGTCRFILHQSKEPEELLEFIKDKNKIFWVQ